MARIPFAIEKSVRNNSFLFLLFLSTLSWSFGHASVQCHKLFSANSEKVFIQPEAYKKDVDQLRTTITGNFATVWRSEWKTKLDVNASNQYVYDLVKKFLTPETQEKVLAGIGVNSDSFTRTVHSRLWELQDKNLLPLEEQLAVRDRPAPEGARDTTFTYYTKAISTVHGDGKHQVRIRTYLREIKAEDIPVGENVEAFNEKEQSITITRTNKTTVQTTVKKNEIVTSDKTQSLQEFHEKYGQSLFLFAPHGKAFKLEIKTALNDEIKPELLPKLAGKHMVQKLDVVLTPAQVAKLFAKLKSTTTGEKFNESLTRLQDLENELLEKTPEKKARIEAVFQVLREGLGNEDFLQLEGATAYHRTAFETKTGLQTTIDRDQRVYIDNMYSKNSLVTPILTVQNNKFLKTKDDDARHVELKVPVTSMMDTVGITFADPSTAPQPQNPQFNERIKQMETIFHGFVKNNLHQGKFHYIQDNGD